MRIVPIHPEHASRLQQPSIDRTRASSPVLPSSPTNGAAVLLDRLGRPFTDLRISVTDRCNFRCPYCMPRTVYGPEHRFLPYDDILTFEELTRLAGVFASLGMRKLRITGGEPLMRKDLPRLISMLKDVAQRGGDPLDMALTTNGALLARHAAELKAAGLRRITVSLDALDDDLFRAMSDSQTSVTVVLEGIEAAQRVGLASVKVNMVVRRGCNEDQILPMAEYFSGQGVELRFIEYMDVGTSNGWRMHEVMSAPEMLTVLKRRFDLSSLAREPGDTAMRFIDRASGATFGIIASITSPFCGDCARLRLSSDGRLRTCLFAPDGHDLRALLRQGESDETLASFIARLWTARSDRYSEVRTSPHSHATDPAPGPRPEMSYIGG